MVNVGTGIITTVAGGGSCTFSCSYDNVKAVGAYMNQPAGLSMDNHNNLLVADSALNRIARIIIYPTAGYTLGNLYNVAGYNCMTCISRGYGGDGQVATSSSVKLANPQGVTCDSVGNIFIADTGNHRIRMVTFSTKIISTIAGNGNPGYGGDNGMATGSQLSNPLDVACDSQGNVYVADAGNNMLRMIHMNNGMPGMIMALAGVPGQKGYNGDNIAATTAWLNFPAGVFLDNYDNPYVADRDNNRIRKITQNTLLGGMIGQISTIAGNGNKGFSGDGGPATSAQLSGPAGLAVDRLNNIWIADTQNNRVRRTIAPSPSPTASPTHVPSLPPSSTPTLQPIAIPTSAMPSVNPSPAPTPSPSTRPSQSPTYIPTFSPTAPPTLIPSAFPSQKPSRIPTQIPFAFPTPGRLNHETLSHKYTSHSSKKYKLSSSPHSAITTVSITHLTTNVESHPFADFFALTRSTSSFPISMDRSILF